MVHHTINILAHCILDNMVFRVLRNSIPWLYEYNPYVSWRNKRCCFFDCNICIRAYACQCVLWWICLSDWLNIRYGINWNRREAEKNIIAFRKHFSFFLGKYLPAASLFRKIFFLPVRLSLLFRHRIYIIFSCIYLVNIVIFGITIINGMIFSIAS